jgi:hypothetical protein
LTFAWIVKKPTGISNADIFKGRFPVSRLSNDIKICGVHQVLLYTGLYVYKYVWRQKGKRRWEEQQQNV